MLKILNLIEKILNLIEKILIEKNFNKINLIKEDSLLKKIFKIFIDYLRFVKGFFQKRFIYLAEYIEYYFDQP
jgi:hypothetical protein